MPSPTIEDTAARLAALLTYAGGALADPDRHDLLFEEHIELRRLARAPAPVEVWAIDGGQAVVADARCLQLVVTRASRVLWRDGTCIVEDEGELRPQLIGCGEERTAVVTHRLPVRPDATVDIGLLRDWGEWQAVARTVDEAEPGALVLVDGDLQPDWRIPPSYLAALLDRAATRRVTLAGVTKHSSLARGGAPLLGQLEREGEAQLGGRAMWWAKVASTRPAPDGSGPAGPEGRQPAPVRPGGRQAGPSLQILAARLDPDARFSFRVDLPAGADAVAVLGALSSIADDAAFPGYPYPLSVADRLAACPGWVREDVWSRLEDGLDLAGVPLDVRERAFTDRHRLMERA